MAVADQILQALARGELKEGDRLPSDRELAQLMGVSRPTVREGLLALQLAGLVEVRPGEGAYITGQDNGSRALESLPGLSMEPAEVIEARLMVEPVIARLAAERHDAGSLETLRENIERCAEVAEQADGAKSFARVGLEFHSLLAPVSDNRYLSHFCISLVDVVEHPLWELLNRQIMRPVQARRGQVAEHRAILDAIERRDAVGAEQSMSEHLERLRGAAFGQVATDPGQEKAASGP